MIRDITELTKKPWQTIGDAQLDELKDVPTMLAPSEQQLYYWLTSHWTNDIGAIVELGSFLGGSTARLAAGHMAANNSNLIHAYDFFKADWRTKTTELYSKGIEKFKGRDFYWLTRELLEPWEDRITYHRGDILSKSWDESPIELLVIDAAKSANACDKIAQTFFPHMIVGESLLVQQDYFHWRLPWIAAQMNLLKDWFKPVAYCPNSTVVYQNIRQIDEEALQIGRVADLTDAELLEHLEQSKVQARIFKKTRTIMKMKRAVAANPDVRAGYQLKDPDKKE